MKKFIDVASMILGLIGLFYFGAYMLGSVLDIANWFKVPDSTRIFDYKNVKNDIGLWISFALMLQYAALFRIRNT